MDIWPSMIHQSNKRTLARAMTSKVTHTHLGFGHARLRDSNRADI